MSGIKCSNCGYALSSWDVSFRVGIKIAKYGGQLLLAILAAPFAVIAALFNGEIRGELTRSLTEPQLMAISDAFANETFPCPNCGAFQRWIAR